MEEGRIAVIEDLKKEHQLCREELLVRITVLEVCLRDLRPVEVRDFMATTLKVLEDCDKCFIRLEGLISEHTVLISKDIPEMIHEVKTAAAYRKGMIIVISSIISALVGAGVAFGLSKLYGQ